MLTLMSIEVCDESKVSYIQLEHCDRSSVVSYKGVLVGGVIRTQASQGDNYMHCATKYRIFRAVYNKNKINLAATIACINTCRPCLILK